MTRLLREHPQIDAELAQQSPFLLIPRRLRAAVQLGYLTPQEASLALAAALGIPLPQAQQQIATGMPSAPPSGLLGPNGQPVGPPPGQAPLPGVPQAPGVPQVPPVAPLPPDTGSLANQAMMRGPVGPNAGPGTLAIASDYRPLLGRWAASTLVLKESLTANSALRATDNPDLPPANDGVVTFYAGGETIARLPLTLR